MNKKEAIEKLSSYRGRVISDSTVIESALGWRLRIYFFPKNCRQASIFYYNVIKTPSFNFDKKISLYEQIPYFKKLKRYPQIKKSLRFVQKLRNALAHWELDEKLSNDIDIVVYNPNTFEKLTVNDQLLQEFELHDRFLLKVFGWKQTLKEKYGGTSELI